ncbi:MAG: hypothetical protein HY297_05860 [Thaumarchaeota archaeon]|nr:hypothetical protein [Nitrososphaerota archaeon]
MASKTVLGLVVIVLLSFAGATLYGASLGGNSNGTNPSSSGNSSSSSSGASSTSGTQSSESSSAQTTAQESCAGTCTTLSVIMTGAFPTATDKQGTGGTTVTVKGLQVLKILTESDGDWHVYVTDGQVSVFITEIIPRDQAAEGKPAIGSTIDETGTPYCDTVHQTEAWHGNTCWEIHPVTAWQLSSQTLTVTTTYTAAPLNVTISYAHNPITRGSAQTITVAVIDSDGPVVGQAVHIHVVYASGSTTKDYDCTTAADGSCSYTWIIGSTSNPGTFLVSVTVGGMQYGSSFDVTT